MVNGELSIVNGVSLLTAAKGSKVVYSYFSAAIGDNVAARNAG